MVINSHTSLDDLVKSRSQACEVSRCHPVHSPSYFWQASSKSLSIRALILASIAKGTSVISNILQADDTQACLQALNDLGVVYSVAGDKLYITGKNLGEAADLATTINPPTPNSTQPVSLDLKASGITLRFLMAVLCARKFGPRIILNGDPSLQRRNSQPLCDALKELGYTQSTLNPHLPTTIHGGGLSGGHISLSPHTSSQFLSALLIATPLATRPTEITLTAPPRSASYIKLTLHLMRKFGIVVQHNPDLTHFVITPGVYQAQHCSIEADMSSMCYLWAWSAIHQLNLTVRNVPQESQQGDRQFLKVLQRLGCNFVSSPPPPESSANHHPPLTTITITPHNQPQLIGGFTVDLSDMPDQMMTLAVLATLSDAPITITGIDVVRGHECDRIEACTTILHSLTVPTVATAGSITIWPMHTPPSSKICIPTFDDHRIAMAFSLLASKHPNIQIASPYVVTKSFPDFYKMLAELGCWFRVVSPQ